MIRTVRPAPPPRKKARGGPPDAVDVLVGCNIRALRLAKGLSQSALAKRIGVTFQQVQKYENAANRVGAGRLARIAEALEVPVGTLFEGVELRDRRPDATSPLRFLAEPLTFRLAQAFAAVDDAELKRRVVGLVEHMTRKRT